MNIGSIQQYQPQDAPENNAEATSWPNENNNGSALDRLRDIKSDLEKLVSETSSLEKLFCQGEEKPEAKPEDKGGEPSVDQVAGNAPGQTEANGGGNARNDPQVKEILDAISSQPDLKWLSDALAKSSINWGPMPAGAAGTTGGGGGEHPEINLDVANKNNLDLLAKVIVHEGIHAHGGGEEEAYAKDDVIANQIGYGSGDEGA